MENKNMNILKKTIWFDQNSEPQKSYIWYRGEGKFYEYSGGNWVLTYDLANTPTQSELESIADKLSDGSEETVDANIGSILNALSDKIEGILDLIPDVGANIAVVDVTNIQRATTAAALDELLQVWDITQEELISLFAKPISSIRDGANTCLTKVASGYSESDGGWGVFGNIDTNGGGMMLYIAYNLGQNSVDVFFTEA